MCPTDSSLRVFRAARPRALPCVYAFHAATQSLGSGTSVKSVRPGAMYFGAMRAEVKSGGTNVFQNVAALRPSQLSKVTATWN